MIETWKDIVGYEGTYMVSDHGRVKSLKWGKERILKQTLTSGYLAVNLSKEGKQKRGVVHVEVAKAFLNHVSCGNKLVVDHKNEITVDNRLENLQIITQRENRDRSIDKTKTSSQYRGVTWDKGTNKWMAQIRFNGKKHYFGRFTDELKANKAVIEFKKENGIN